MGFFKDLKDDASQAVKELMPEDELSKGGAEEDLLVNTLEGELDMESELSKLNGLLESVPAEEKVVKEQKEEVVKQEETGKDANVKEELFMSMDTEIPENVMGQTGVREPVMPTLQSEESVQAVQEKVGMPETPIKMSEVAISDEILDEVTLITEGSSLTGNLQSKGSIDLRGSVVGDVQCNGKLTVTGMIRGNTTSSEFFADNAKMEGEVTTSGTVKIGLGSVVIGNITASSAVIAGAIKGDIDVQGPVVVDTSAVVMGNIKSRSVQINNGAVIEGFCSQCYADVDMESLFVE